MSTDSILQVGKYRIIAELGHGGMADVFLGVVEGPAGSGFAKLGVVKRLRPHLVEDPEFVTMLIDEARLTGRLNHPNVVQMLEVGVEGSEYFLAMEYLDGQPLHRLERRATNNGFGGVPKEAIYLIAADSLAGLHHAHELRDYDGTPLNIVHRDLTPQNIFITYDGQVKVVDFGIAKAAGRLSETQHGVVKGKVRYMSPEQAVGLGVDRRSDVFAAGILVWQAATGRRFWGDMDDLAIVQSLVAGSYEASPRAVCPEVPEAIDAICRKALAQRPEDRYATADLMRADLEAFLADRILPIRRALVSLVTKLFDKERVQLRGILNASVPSMTGTAFIPRIPTSGSVSLQPAALGADSSGSNPISSVAPMTLDRDNVHQGAGDSSTSLAELLEPPEPHRTSGRPPASRATSFAATVTAIAAVALFVVGIIQSRTLSAQAAAASTTFVQGSRSSQIDSPHTLAFKSDVTVRAGRTQDGTRFVTIFVPAAQPAAAPAPVAPAPVAVVAPHLDAAPVLGPAPRGPGKGRMGIDATDPW